MARGVFSTGRRSQGPRDAGGRLGRAQPIIDKRMTGRCGSPPVLTMSVHVERAAIQLQDVWEPGAAATCQEVHMIGGFPRAPDGVHRRPVQRARRRRRPQPGTALCLPSHSGVWKKVARARSSPIWPARVSTSRDPRGYRSAHVPSISDPDRRGAASTMASAPEWRA